MIRFAHPLYLHLLWLLPLLALAVYLEYKWRLKSAEAWAKEALWDVAIPDRSPSRILLRRGLSIAAIGFAILAIAGPQVGTKLTEITREGTDIVIALDLSKSMLAEDLTPNRLLKARHEILRLLQRLRGDRVALVPFAGVAFVQVPLTLDYGAVGSVLTALEPGIIPHPGTALGEAIKQARKAFRAGTKAQKIMILVTDGEDHEEGAVEQAKEAAAEGVLIFTVGMASPGGAPIPERDEQGNVRGYKSYSSEGTIVSKLNEELLAKIADATGGEFLRDNSSGDEFRKILERISGMDKQKFEQKQFTDYEDRFQWPLTLAFLLLVIEELIPAYRVRRKEEA
jgi:Ca-activated chloride channel family protein